jgi:hypothetical protein
MTIYDLTSSQPKVGRTRGVTESGGGKEKVLTQGVPPTRRADKVEISEEAKILAFQVANETEEQGEVEQDAPRPGMAEVKKDGDAEKGQAVLAGAVAEVEEEAGRDAKVRDRLVIEDDYGSEKTLGMITVAEKEAMSEAKILEIRRWIDDGFYDLPTTVEEVARRILESGDLEGVPAIADGDQGSPFDA